MNYRYRATPVTLARNTPIAQPIVYLALCLWQFEQQRLFQALRHHFVSLLCAHPVKEFRVYNQAIASISHLIDLKISHGLFRRAHNRRYLKTILVSEV